MKNLPKDKRNRLILIVMITIVGVAGLWFGVINMQQGKLRTLDSDIVMAQGTLTKIEQNGKNAERVENEMLESKRNLERVEEDMASGDLYAWMLKNIGLLKLQYKVEIPSLSPPEVKDVTLLPKFPYKQASYAIGGTAYFHDLGKFVADFENQNPYSRLVNLDIQPEPSIGGSDKEVREKLTFKMDVITLIKPGGF